MIQGADSGFVTLIFDLLLVVQLGQEDRVLVELVKPEPGSKVIGWSKPVLDPNQLRHIAENVVGKGAVPFVALLINTDTTMGRTICK